MKRYSILAWIFLLMSCGSQGDFSDENPDPFCRKLLAEKEPVELRSWLYDGRSTLGELQTNSASTAFADEGYKAGATNIYGIDVDDDQIHGRNTGNLVVELPDSPSQREAVINWAAPVAWEQGFDAYGDVGQRYIFVKMD